MAEITFKGNTIHTSGSLPEVGTKAPDFTLTDGSLNDVHLSDYAGKKRILNIVPSLDTGVCATSARTFDKEIASLGDTVVLTISDDLPFAQSRFCESENIDQVVTLSEMRERSFGDDYGVRMVDGPLAGILSRAVVVIDDKDQVVYTEQVPEIAQEPDYQKALEAARKA